MNVNLLRTEFSSQTSKIGDKKVENSPNLKQKPDEFKTEKKRSFKEKLAAFGKKMKIEQYTTIIEI